MLTVEQWNFIDQFVTKLPSELLLADALPPDGNGLDAALREWGAALDAVDGQIAKLCQVLISSGDPELKQIAEFGVNAVTGNQKVRLQAALIGLRSGGSNLSKDAAKALPLVEGFRAYVRKAEPVAACDENPFGVTVEIRSTLGPALDRLSSELQRIAT